MIKKCAGCGVVLQYQEKEVLGYIPEDKYENSLYCQRCFKMTHYGINSIDDNPYANDEIIKRINNNPKFTIFLIDFLNINDEVIKLFLQVKCEKALIINKCEMLPKFLNKNQISEFLKKNYSIQEDIILKGSNGSREYEEIYDYINKKNLKELYLVGLSNVGKSTLINDLIKLTKSDIPKVTVNKKKNTTLDFNTIKLSSFTIIDTPGFIINNYLQEPSSKKIKSYIFQMKENETLNLTKDFFISFSSNTNLNYFTHYLNEKTIKKNYKTNLHHLTEMEIEKNSDLIILGLGFIRFKTKTKIKTNIDKKHLKIRPSLFGRD